MPKSSPVKTKARVPKGWRRITSGNVEHMDLWKWHKDQSAFVPARTTTGTPVKSYYLVIRRITRKARK